MANKLGIAWHGKDEAYNHTQIYKTDAADILIKKGSRVLPEKLHTTYSRTRVIMLLRQKLKIL